MMNIRIAAAAWWDTHFDTPAQAMVGIGRSDARHPVRSPASHTGDPQRSRMTERIFDR
jgi:hypothetical protein